MLTRLCELICLNNVLFKKKKTDAFDFRPALCWSSAHLVTPHLKTSTPTDTQSICYLHNLGTGHDNDNCESEYLLWKSCSCCSKL